MSTRKTTNGYRVTLEIDNWQEKFDYYEDVKVCFKDVLRSYKLDEITSDFRLANWEVDYLLGKITKEEAMDEAYVDEDDLKKIDEYKKNYQVVWLSIWEHSNFSVWYGEDWVMLVEKDASQELIHELVKELEAWFNGWIYRINIFEAEKFVSEENWRKLIAWEYIDWQGGYFTEEQAFDSLPDYVGEVIKSSRREHFEEFERC